MKKMLKIIVFLAFISWAVGPIYEPKNSDLKNSTPTQGTNVQDALRPDARKNDSVRIDFNARGGKYQNFAEVCWEKTKIVSEFAVSQCRKQISETACFLEKEFGISKEDILSAPENIFHFFQEKIRIS